MNVIRMSELLGDEEALLQAHSQDELMDAAYDKAAADDPDHVHSASKMAVAETVFLVPVEWTDTDQRSVAA